LIETNGDQKDIIDQQGNNEGEVLGEIATANASIEPVTMVVISIDAFLADEAMARPWGNFNFALRAEVIKFDLIDQNLLNLIKRYTYIKRILGNIIGTLCLLRDCSRICLYENEK